MSNLKALSTFEGLCLPKLQMRFLRKGHDVWLKMGHVYLWHWHVKTGADHAYGWTADPSLMAFERKMQRYLDLPVEQIKAGLPTIEKRNGWRGTPSPVDVNTEILYTIMRSADRRIGKNWIQLQLFIDPSILCMDVLKARLVD